MMAASISQIKREIPTDEFNGCLTPSTACLLSAMQNDDRASHASGYTFSCDLRKNVIWDGLSKRVY